MQETIVHIVSSTQLGGLERRLEMLSENSSISQYKHIFVAIGGLALKKSSLPRTAEVHFIAEGHEYSYRISSIIKLFFLLKSISPLAVHAHGVHSIIHGMPAAFFSGVKTRIAEFIGMQEISKKVRFLLRIALCFSTTALGISRLVANKIRSEFPSCSKKVEYIYNPVYLKNRFFRPATSKLFIVCVVARLEPVKNVIALVDAFAEFSSSVSETELWVIGTGSEESKIKELIRKKKLAEKVKLYGYLNDPTPFLCRSSLYVQPSLTEAFGIAIAEAMLCEVPVIVSSNAGMADFVENNRSGWVVPDVSERTLTHYLHKAYAKWPDDIQLMGQRARYSARKNFSIREYIGKLDDLYAR